MSEGSHADRGNVLDGIFDDLARTGEINPARTLWNIGIGFVQGSTGSGIRDGLLSKLGIEGCSFGNHLIKTFLGGFIDTGIDGVGSALSEQDFDLKSSLIQNLFFNGLDAFISDPCGRSHGNLCHSGYGFPAGQRALCPETGTVPIILPIIRSLYWGWDGNSHMPAGYIGIQGMWSIPGFIWRPSRVILCATRSRMAVG